VRVVEPLEFEVEIGGSSAPPVRVGPASAARHRFGSPLENDRCPHLPPAHHWSLVLRSWQRDV